LPAQVKKAFERLSKNYFQNEIFRFRASQMRKVRPRSRFSKTRKAYLAQSLPPTDEFGVAGIWKLQLDIVFRQSRRAFLV